MNHINRIFRILVITSAISTSAIAADMPFKFTHYGNFKHMMHTGDDRGTVKLSEVPQQKNTWGLGALAGRTGEIIQMDGKILVSPGSDLNGKILPHDPNEQAFLFASGQVSKWHDISLSSDMNQSQLEAFILEEAKRLGLSTEQPFVFRLQGKYPQLRWHVVTGKKPQPVTEQTGSHTTHAKKHHVEKYIFNNPDARGQLIGIYSGPQLESVVTHPNEYFHAHYIDDQADISGHVEAYSVAKGTILKLPLQ
ncbi:hypothetical protein BS636_15865 (plasmid) [Acinetobacter sp. LoGeW2-3]|uniref:acetolactate decarboxylase n=1 Tax=Acinetobacter sp. LoGeW2-3 TaxID=1808001 RepID=UPI000C05A479|nr:acetolactate decarboxylase [Acinetobacter sp. LoGeW2-3]ATO21172.1 hypothetical protein BS636_15865 [Acinetobacter sp. LoGeW2-3]